MKVIVCGAGNVAYRVIELLDRLKETITVIVLNEEEILVKNIKKLNLTICIGNAEDQDVLLKAGIKDSDAFMALTGSEVDNIEMSILARELNPKIKIVTRIFDENLSQKIQSGFKIDKMLSAAALSSSTFVSACMDEKIVHSFPFEGKMNYLADCELDEKTFLSYQTVEEAEKKSNLKILLHSKIKNFQNEKNINKMEPGDKILYSTFEKKIVSKLSDNKKNKFSAMPIKQKKAKQPFIRFFSSIPKNVKWIGAVYFSLILLSMAVFSFGLNISLIDAFYFVITTTTTVGYGDFNLQNASLGVKLFGCFVMLCGAALLAAIFSVITDSIVTKKFNLFFNLGKSKLKNHIVVAGLGNIGYRVLNLLAESKEKIIAIEKDNAV